ncbi:MAG: hypothetical protein ACOC0Q_08955 [Wenzhouxiangella sp.]
MNPEANFWTDYGLMLLANIGISLILIPVAVAGLFIALRLRDRIGGISWPAMRGKIMGTPTGAALYAGAWVIAVALILSAAIR